MSAAPARTVRALVSRYGDLSLTDYARDVLPVHYELTDDHARTARTILLDAVASYAHRQTGASRAEVEEAFRRLPILATGMHASLLLGAPTFTEHAVTLLAARVAGSPFVFTKSTCRVSMITWSGYGPGYVDCADGPVRVFDLSRKKMKRSCVHSAHDVHALAFRDPARPAERKALCAVAEVVGDLSTERVCDAYTLANRRLVRRWVRPDEPQTIFADHLPQDVVAGHLRHGSEQSPLARIVLDTRFRGRFYAAYRRHRRAWEPSFEHSTDLFWHAPDGRLRPLRVEGTRLVGDVSGVRHEYPLTSDALADALERGALLPDLPLTFLGLAVLPRVRVTGGPNQVGYTSALAAAYAQVCDDAQYADEVSSGWVFGAVSPFFRPVDLLTSADDPAVLSAATDRWADMRVRETVGDLSRFLTTAGLE